MSRRIVRRSLSAAAVCALSAGLAAAPAMAASSHKVSWKAKGGTEGNTLTMAITGKPFSGCKGVGTFNADQTSQYEWKCPGGSTVNIHLVGKCGLNEVQCGSWEFTGGSGKWKKLSGKGTFSGRLSTGVLTFKGTAKY